MSINNEGTPAPGSIEAQAIAELEKEGHIVGTGQPDINDGEIKDTPAPSKVEVEIKDKPAEPPKETPKDEPKTNRSPKMVEAWKLNVAEDQKSKLEKDLNELRSKVEEMSKQKSPITSSQEKDIADEIKTIAEGREGVDVELLTKFADTILKKAEAKYKPSSDIEKTINELKESNQFTQELNLYSQEFEKDVLPLVKEYQLSDTALSGLKETLKEFAFSETYAKVPLREIFAIKQSTLNLSVPKKSSEGKTPKGRSSEVVDLDNLDEESFSKLSPDQIEVIASRNTTGWNKPQNRK